MPLLTTQSARGFGFSSLIASVPGTFESIATQTVASGGTGTITFTSIPSTYKHLHLRIFAQTNRTTYGIDEAYMTFNSDTTSGNYSNHRTFSDGSTANASAGNNESKILMGSGHLGTTVGGGNFGVIILDIFDYSSANKNKTTRLLGGTDHNGQQYGGIGGRVGQSSGVWMNSSSAISTISIVPANSSLFTEYSSFALYGIKG
jgi:hypothetical protein